MLRTRPRFDHVVVEEPPQQQQQQWGIGNRVLPDNQRLTEAAQHARGRHGQHLESQWSIGNRVLPEGDRLTEQAQRDRAYAQQPPQQQEWGIGNRVLPDSRRLTDQAQHDRAYAPQQDWGIGNRIITDSRRPRRMTPRQAAPWENPFVPSEQAKQVAPAASAEPGDYGTAQYYRARNMHGQIGGPLSKQDVANAGLGEAGSAAHFGQGIADLRGDRMNSADAVAKEQKRRAMVAEWDAQVQAKRAAQEKEKADQRQRDIQDLQNEALGGNEAAKQALAQMGITGQQQQQEISPTQARGGRTARGAPPPVAVRAAPAPPSEQEMQATRVARPGALGSTGIRELDVRDERPRSRAGKDRVTRFADLYEDLKAERHRFAAEMHAAEIRKATIDPGMQELSSESQMVYSKWSEAIGRPSAEELVQDQGMRGGDIPIDVSTANPDQLDILLQSFLARSRPTPLPR